MQRDLKLPATNLLEPDMELVTNSQGSQVTIEGDNVENMKQLVRQVGYLNRQFEFEKIVADILYIVLINLINLVLLSVVLYEIFSLGHII